MSTNIHPKFVLINDAIILGKVEFHREFAHGTDNISSGGWFSVDGPNKTFTLYGSSDDFGRATLREVQHAVEHNKVFSNYEDESKHSLTHKYKFIFKDETKRKKLTLLN